MLEETDPSQDLRLTGSAVSWRTEDLAFEVGGRVAWVVEEGSELEAPWGEGEADPIARIDDSRYRIKVDGAQAALDSAIAEKATLQAELDHVIPANLEAAKASTVFRKAEVKRYEEAIKTNAVSKSDLEEKVASLDVALANEKEIEATSIATKAKINAAEARAALERENLRQANIDLEDCVLATPYPAEVAKVHAIVGAVVSAGEPAATLTVMNPIKVVVSVSSTIARQVKFGDAVNVFPPAADGEAHPGSIFNKSTTADPETRTFEVEIITRNYKVATELTDDEAVRALPRVAQIFYPVSISSSVQLARDQGAVVSSDEPWYVNEIALHGDEQSGFHVWRAKGLTRDDLADLDPPVLTLEKLPVQLAEGRVNAFGLYKLREVRRDGELKSTDVFPGAVPEGTKNGDRVAYVREEWLLRPGALVPIELGTASPPPGLYVPMKAVQKQTGGTPFVFLVEDDGEGGKRTRRTEVTVTANVGELIRIEGDGIAAGARVVLDGAHYLVDGDAVSISEEVRSR